MPSARFKSVVRKLHLVLALVSSLPLVILGVTGTLLVFPDTVQDWVSSIDYQVEPAERMLPPSQLIAAARSQLSEHEKLWRLMYPKRPDLALVAQAEHHEVVIDPYRGTVLGVLANEENFMRVVTSLHVSLCAGMTGVWITGISSLFLVALCLTGIYLWWPRGRWKRDYFTIDVRKGWLRTNYDVHRAVGLYTATFLLLIAGTGATMAFWRPMSAIVYWLTFSAPAEGPPQKVPVLEGSQQLSPDQILAIAQREAPGLEIGRFYVPAAEDRPYRVFLVPRDELEQRWSERRFSIDPYSGAILHEDGPASQSRGDSVLRWVLPLHFGNFAGLPTRVLYLFVSSTPVLLLASGLALWQTRRRRQAAADRVRRAMRKRAVLRKKSVGPAVRLDQEPAADHDHLVGTAPGKDS